MKDRVVQPADPNAPVDPAPSPKSAVPATRTGPALPEKPTAIAPAAPATPDPTTTNPAAPNPPASAAPAVRPAPTDADGVLAVLRDDAQEAQDAADQLQRNAAAAQAQQKQLAEVRRALQTAQDESARLAKSYDDAAAGYQATEKELTDFVNIQKKKLAAAVDAPAIEAAYKKIDAAITDLERDLATAETDKRTKRQAADDAQKRSSEAAATYAAAKTAAATTKANLDQLKQARDEVAKIADKEPLKAYVKLLDIERTLAKAPVRPAADIRADLAKAANAAATAQYALTLAAAEAAKADNTYDVIKLKLDRATKSRVEDVIAKAPPTTGTPVAPP